MTSTRCALLCSFMIACIGCSPKDERPGLWVSGDVVEAGDFGCTPDVEEVFIETRPWYLLPHSTTIWCVEHDGALYIGSYDVDRKFWEQNVASRPDARLAIAGKVHKVTVIRVTRSGLVEGIDEAYEQKYDMVEVFGEEVPEWRYYHVARRGS